VQAVQIPYPRFDPYQGEKHIEKPNTIWNHFPNQFHTSILFTEEKYEPEAYVNLCNTGDRRAAHDSLRRSGNTGADPGAGSHCRS
jgi:hypothetical protein